MSTETGIIKKDKSIQIIRIISMFLIILCHIVQESNNTILNMSAQFFNVGVFVFLFISGFLYGKKDITNTKAFYLKRFLKILLPIYIFILFLYLVTFIVYKNVEIKYLFIYFLNLQFMLGSMEGAGHLWFISIITICYLLTPFLSHKKATIIRYGKYIVLMLMFFSIISSFISPILSKILLYFITYLLGYIFGYENKTLNTKLSIILAFFSIILRLLCKHYFDGTFIYDIYITFFTHIILAISIFSILKNTLSKLLLKNEKLINYFDEYSYYIYIMHYMFFSGPLKIVNFTSCFVLNIVIALIFTCLSAIILHFIYDLICKKRFLNLPT